jgi:hypothetical protein
LNYDGPGVQDVLAVILLPLIVAVLTVVYLLGWWTAAGWAWWRRGR